MRVERFIETKSDTIQNTPTIPTIMTHLFAAFDFIKYQAHHKVWNELELDHQMKRLLVNNGAHIKIP